MQILGQIFWGVSAFILVLAPTLIGYRVMRYFEYRRALVKYEEAMKELDRLRAISEGYISDNNFIRYR